MWTQEKRRRVTQACSECKKKKKQCSGTHPCTTCTKKSLKCTFSNTISPDNDFRENSGHSDYFHKPSATQNELLSAQQYQKPQAKRLDRHEEAFQVSTADEETLTQNPGRLLQDGEGRLLYVGDSATVSFLHSIRKLVEQKLGPSPFTLDSSQSKILEAAEITPPSTQNNFALPKRETAQFLIDSFFANTAGLFDIFERNTFEKKVAETFQCPLDADSRWLCQLNLVFAVGFRMHKDANIININASKILENLGSAGAMRAERFYLAARKLSDPVVDFEVGGIMVVQSLLLMAIYTLASSQRNKAWGHVGMAINLAYALGIHNEETMSVFSPSEQCERRNLWQSLNVMDCFLATSLGRPSAISSDIASQLNPISSGSFKTTMSPRTNDLSYAVDVSKITREILSHIYRRGKAPRSIAYVLSLRLREWMKQLPSTIRWQTSSIQGQDPNSILKLLHINLIYLHGILLLTRPFLLDRISRIVSVSNIPQEGSPGEPITHGIERNDNKSSNETERHEQEFCFHGACVRSATHSITAIHVAFARNALPRRDPFVIYWLFSAAMVVLANQFCSVYSESDGDFAVQMAMKIMRYFGDADPQARRYQTILELFANVLDEYAKAKEQATSQAYKYEDMFNLIFENEASASNAVASPTEDQSLATAAASFDAIGSIAAPNTIGGLDSLYPLPGVGTELMRASWTEALAESSNNGTNGDNVWWNSGQDILTTSGYFHIPVYGLV